MAKKIDANQPLVRREPRQERALHKVELIFEAATRLLEQKVPAEISTNAIAKLAGISIGTLYQYFPDKDTLFQALTARELHSLSERLMEIMDTPALRPGGRIGAALAAVLDTYGGRGIAHQRLMKHSLERGSTGLLGPMLERLVSNFTQKGIVGPGVVIPPMSRVDAFVLTHAVGGVLRAAVGEQVEGALDRIALEKSLMRLILGFAAQTPTD